MKTKNIVMLTALLGTTLLIPTFLASTTAATGRTVRVSVSISGELTSIGNPNIRVIIQANAIGDPHVLLGRGSNSPAVSIGDPHVIPPGPCIWTLAGAVEPDTRIIRLAGSATDCLDARLDGASVSVLGDANTGEIAFFLGDFQFAGVGNVVIGNPGI